MQLSGGKVWSNPNLQLYILGSSENELAALNERELQSTLTGSFSFLGSAPLAGLLAAHFF